MPEWFLIVPIVFALLWAISAWKSVQLRSTLHPLESGNYDEKYFWRPPWKHEPEWWDGHGFRYFWIANISFAIWILGGALHWLI